MSETLKKMKPNKRSLPIIFGVVLAFLIITIAIISIIHSSKAKEIEFISVKDNFRADENLAFRFKYRGNGEPQNLNIKVIVFDYKGEEVVQLNPHLGYGENGEILIDLTEYFRNFKPGKYRLKFEIEDKNNGKTYVENKDFTWGVLAINTNKSIYPVRNSISNGVYLPNETVYIQMAALRDDGHTVCNADLKLKIKNEKLKIETELSTENGGIKYSGECGADNVTDVPDYFAYYQINEPGIYQMKLTNLDNGYEIEDSFEVKESVPFDIERIGPTRIYPPAEYQMTLRIKANQDFVGEVVEYVPERFEIKNQNAKVKMTNQNSKSIIWNVNWKKDEICELKYIFDAPDVSPYLYLLGPLEIGDWQEARKWQIATDSPNTRARTVTIFAGQYSGTGSAGQNGAASQSFSQFDIELAESTVSIKNAFIILEAQLGGLADDGNIAGYALAFDTCSGPCTPDVWAGANHVSVDTQNGVILAYADTEAGEYIRLLFDVTSEAQLSGYSGGSGSGGYLSAALGYWFDAATTDTDLINSAKAKLVITYTYSDTGNSLTSTVIYPLESQAGTDQGSRQSSQTVDCQMDSNCPLFNYNMNIAEFSQRVSQWLEVGAFNDGNVSTDIKHGVNIGTNASSSFILEAAQSSGQGNWSQGWYSGVSGFSENTAQQLEHYYSGSGTLYLIGGEVFETYTASASASPKTKTVSYPMGIVTDGSSTTGVEASTTVFFPETGVTIKSAWFRIIVAGDDVDGNAYIYVSTKVGNNNDTASLSYLYNPPGLVPVESFGIIHVIASGSYAAGSDYDELDNATATSGKTVYLNIDASTANSRAKSAELMITYTYTGESSGYMTSLNLYGGQTTGSGGSTLSENVSTANSVLPETSGTKTMRNATLRASYVFSDSDGTAPAGPGNVEAGLSTATPDCSSVTHDTDADSADAFQEIYHDVTSSMNTTDNQTYTACYATDRHGDADTGGSKMNGILIYTYQWDAPAGANVSQAHFRWRNDDGGEAGGTDWYNSSWLYRKEITINSTVVSESDSGIANFPVMINIASDSDLSGDAQPDGDDILFTSSNGTTKIDHEIEKYDNQGDLVAWVEAPSLSSTSNTELYMYYGNSGATNQENVSGSWDSNYIGVWHMDDATTSSISESTSYGMDGTKYAANQPIQYPDGKIGNAQDFDGSDDYVNIPDSTNWTLSSGIDRTMEGWFNFKTLLISGDWDSIIGNPVVDTYSFQFSYDGGVKLNWWDGTIDHPSPVISISTGVWYHYVLTLDFGVTNGSHWYLNGADLGAFTAENRSEDPTALKIGAGCDALEQFTGRLDEVRISNALRSAYWISNEYNNVASSSAFYGVGSEEPYSSGATWKRAEDTLHSGQAKSENVRLRFSVKNTGAAASNYQFELQVAAKGSSATCEAVASSSYSVVPTTSGAGCGTSVVCMTTSANFANGDATTNQLTSEGTFVAGKMVEDPSNISGAITINQDYFTEAEYNFQMTTYASNDVAYCFRTTNNGAPLDSYTKVAELTIEPTTAPIIRIKGNTRIKGGTRLK